MTNEQSIAAAIENFYNALNVLFTGDGGPMNNAWSHSEDISYMGPDGLYLIGWEKIGQMWNDVAALKLSGRVIPEQLHTVPSTDLAVITCIEAGENISDGKTQTVKIRSSTVFRKESGAWKVIAHQTDKLSYLEINN